MLFKKKYKQIKSSPKQSNFDQVLWFIEKFLPKKKDRGVQKNLYIDNLESETIKKFWLTKTKFILTIEIS